MTSIWLRLSKAATAVSGLLLAVTAAAQTDAPLVHPQNLVYVGRFSIPTASGNGFDYGGAGLAYNPANNSLFMVGHTYDNFTAELKIPAIGGTATVLQPLRDAFGGKLDQIGDSDNRVGGNFVYKNRLYMTGFIFYDANGSQTRSHFSRSLTLTDSGVTGPYSVGPLGAGFYSGYMTTIPAFWQARLGGPAITGNCCLSIISRTSFGPAAFVFDPEDTSKSAQPLVYYDSSHQTLGTWGASGSNPEFNGTTRITGIVFPDGTSTLLFFGVTGIGNYCYGEAGACNDSDYVYKGDHAPPYRAYVWAYDANDLAAVRTGQKNPWSVEPYQTWELSQLGDVSADFGVGGAAYDPETSRIYVTRKGGNGRSPDVYVYEVDNAIQVIPPAPPESVSVQ